ncbi:DUF3160 domain-containing protein, partial [bacterium]|nr:DUF3160 domain-containing protein [bacterium]
AVTVTPAGKLESPTPAPLQPVQPVAAVSERPFSLAEVVNQAPTEKYAGLNVFLPFNLEKAQNIDVLADLTPAHLEQLEQNGFTLLQTQEEQFYEIRERVAIRHGQPYFLTTDAAYHALHLEFDALLKALEREHLRPQIIRITQALLEEVLTYNRQVEGSSLAGDTALAVAYLAVALKLFDPQAILSPDLEKRIAPQMAQITRAGGREKSALFPAFEDDYGAYKPVGHYSGDPDLETYFQGMTWYGRVQFNFTEVGDLTYQPGKEPLIISTALRRAQIGNRPVYEDWLALHEILNFVIGPSDDPGPLALLALMDQVYGVKPTLAALGDETLWNRFLTGASALPSSQINSTFAASLDDLPKSRGWRFMGQRFT